MRKILAVILMMVLILFPTACDGNGAENNSTADRGEKSSASSEGNEHIHTEEVIPGVEPTCTEDGYTEGERCSECGEVIVECERIPALGHTTDTGTCERCGRSFGIWEVGYYQDEFNQPTDEWVITHVENPAVGTFSNSATTNSELNAYVAYDCNGFLTFILFEYGDHMVKGVYDKEIYRIVMRTSDGEKHEMEGYLIEDMDRIFLLPKYVGDVIYALSGSGEIGFYLEGGKYSKSTYLFTVDASNFAEEYNKVMR